MKALLVIDMQKGDEHTFKNLYNKDKMIKNISKLIEVFKKNKQKVIQIKIWIKNPEKTSLSKKFPQVGIAKTKEAEIIDELKNKDYDKIIKKTNYSSFWNTDLNEYLKKNKIKELYLTGIHTGCCILFTAVDAFYRGYDVYVVEDAVSSVSDKEGIKKKIEKIKELIGESISTEELIKKIK